MGDRNNPIKFGPEWLRNLPREQSAGRSGAGPSAARLGPAGGGRRCGLPASAPAPAPAPAPQPEGAPTKGNSTTKPVLKVRLAKLRYGREEMLALYDRTTEAPEELKFFDLLYQPRGKPPFALNTFEEETRESRGGPAAGAMPTERFGAARAAGRAAGATSETRRAPRGSYARHAPTAAAARGSSPMRAGGARADDEPSSGRPWSANNGPEPADWIGTRTYRRRHNNTNWRQTSRDDGDEWRHSEGQGRSYGRSNSDKWADREWGEGERRPQPWSVARRAWLSADSHHHHNEETSLPEWAVNSPEAGAGTFDSSGAFHGYSKDECSLPKTQESPYPLTRSHTHGSFGGSKAPEEGSAEWWASEKAKKLSPKKFDVADIKIKKPTSTVTKEPRPSIRKLSREEGVPAFKSSSDAREKEPNSERKTESPSSTEESQRSTLRHNFSESQTFESIMPPDVAFGEPPEENEGNFQSVMINPNNGLRQKHQNIVPSMEANIFQRLHGGMPLSSPAEDPDPMQLIEDKIVEEVVEMTLNDTSVPPPNIHVPPPNIHVPPPDIHVPPPNIHVPPPAHNAPPAALAAGAARSLQLGAQPQLQAAFSMQTVAMQSQALNSALGLPIGTAPGSELVVPMRGSLAPTMQNVRRDPIAPEPLRSRPLLGGFRPGGAHGTMPAPTLPGNSPFVSHTTPPPVRAADVRMAGREAPSGPFPPIGVRRPAVEDPIEALYGTMMPQLRADRWYYEDPTNEIQGPFSCKEMDYWYKMGFFSPTMMVRRACDSAMRPLGSYGSLPFAYPIDMQPYHMSTYEAHSQAARDLVEQQRRASINDALWARAAAAQHFSWSPRRTVDRDEDIVNNLPMYFWDPQPNSSSTTLPSGLVKDMKTEDEILAPLRAAPSPPVASFLSDNAPNTGSDSTAASSSDDTFSIVTSPDLEKLQQLIESERQLRRDLKSESDEFETKSDKSDKTEPTEEAAVVETLPAQNKIPSEPKLAKRVKNETERPAKVKYSVNKAKITKKNKEEKKEDAEIKNTAEEIKPEKATVETSSLKSKKEERQSKKDIEKEKKGWIEEGFTIVKGADKSNNKESKKKVEEIGKKRKEDEKLALEEEKKKKQSNVSKKQQEQQRLMTESMVRRAPWSAGSLGAGLPLAEIQRLEREKKLEQVKEQQHMMHLIAQQQAAALAREQEMQANLAWAKNHLDNNGTGPTLAEIQAETRRQAAAAALAAQSIEELIPLPPLQTGLAPAPLPWGGSADTGFWDTQPCLPKRDERQEPPKSSECKTENEVAIAINPKRELSPDTEFDVWCNTMLALWRSKIDVPTFVGFLKDIESPYEVKDYVRYYLGDTKDSNDFARQFLEKRSKLLRAGTATPSDDLCSPAIAVNPRAALADYQEVKGKGKKSKKNKMLKVDARILGFSVTAAEDRINVGDIDTA